MFSNLRTNSQVYILHKGNSPYVETGSVISVSQPMPKFNPTNYMNPQEMVVDVVVKVNENTLNLQKLPANQDIAEQGTATGAIVITTSREAMNSEISALREKSISVVNSIDYHKKIIQDCGVLLNNLNPEFARQEQQKQEIDTLKSQVTEIMSGMKELMAKFKSGDIKNLTTND